MRAGVKKNVVFLTVSVEIVRPLQSPAWRQSRSGAAANESGTIEIPNSSLTRAGVEKDKIGSTVPIEVLGIDQAPTRGQSRTARRALECIAIQEPYRCLPCAG